MTWGRGDCPKPQPTSMFLKCVNIQWNSNFYGIAIFLPCSECVHKKWLNFPIQGPTDNPSSIGCLSLFFLPGLDGGGKNISIAGGHFPIYFRPPIFSSESRGEVSLPQKEENNEEIDPPPPLSYFYVCSEPRKSGLKKNLRRRSHFFSSFGVYVPLQVLLWPEKGAGIAT